MVHIFFDAATFDTIERDEKITLEGQLGLIGGTLGLFTGFSVCSAIEICQFLIKLMFSLKQKLQTNEKPILLLTNNDGKIHII